MALEFTGTDASNDAVELQNVSNISTNGQALTIESIWEYQTLDGSGTFPHVYGGDGSTAGKHWQLWVGSSGSAPVVRMICGGTQYNTSGGSATSANTIYHHFVTYNGSIIQCYRDGATDGSVSATGNLDTLSALWFGDNVTLSPREWDGIIYRIRVWHRVLTLDEMEMARAIRGQDGLYEDLVGWWEFDESPPGTQLSNGSYDVIDLTGRGTDGRAAHATNRPVYRETVLGKRKAV